MGGLEDAVARRLMRRRRPWFLEAGRLQPGETAEEHVAALDALRAELLRERIRPAGILPGEYDDEEDGNG